MRAYDSPDSVYESSDACQISRHGARFVSFCKKTAQSYTSLHSEDWQGQEHLKGRNCHSLHLLASASHCFSSPAISTSHTQFRATHTVKRVIMMGMNHTLIVLTTLIEGDWGARTNLLRGAFCTLPNALSASPIFPNDPCLLSRKQWSEEYRSTRPLHTRQRPPRLPQILLQPGTAPVIVLIEIQISSPQSTSFQSVDYRDHSLKALEQHIYAAGQTNSKEQPCTPRRMVKGYLLLKEDTTGDTDTLFPQQCNYYYCGMLLAEFTVI